MHSVLSMLGLCVYGPSLGKKIRFSSLEEYARLELLHFEKLMGL